MNQCEKVMLDKMVMLNNVHNSATSSETMGECTRDIHLLLDCISEWRNQTSIPVEDGCGAMVVKE